MTGCYNINHDGGLLSHPGNFQELPFPAAA